MANTKTFTINIDGVDTAITNIAQLEKTVERLDNELKQADFGSDSFAQLEKQAKEARAALDKINQSTQETASQANAAGKTATAMGSSFKDAFGIANLAAGNTGEALGSLQGKFGAVQNGLGTVAKGFGTLKGAIASTGIGLLLIAFTKLVTYFTQTQEGINFVQKKTAALQAVFAVFGKVVSGLGKSLFDALSNPKKALTDLVEFIQNNLLNRLKSFGVILDAIRNRDLTKLKDGFIQMGTGIEDASAKLDKLGTQFNALTEQAKAAAAAAEALATSNQKIAASEIELGVKRAESRAQIEGLKKLSDDITKSTQVRLEATKQAASIENKLLAEQLKLQADKIANEVASQKLQASITNEDKQRLAELRKERADTQQESLTLQTELQNKINSINAEAKAKVDAARTEKLAKDKEAAEKQKALVEKMTADREAASAIEFAIQKSQLDRELALAEKGSAEFLAIAVEQKKLETAATLAEIDNKIAKAGEKEKAALLKQREEIALASAQAEKKIETDYNNERRAKAAQDEADVAAIKLIGLKQGTADYYNALINQNSAEKNLALSKLEDTKENEVARNKIIADSLNKETELRKQANEANRLAVEESIQTGFSVASQVAGQLAAIYQAQSDARTKALDAQLAETSAALDAAKQASDELKSQLDASQSRIDDLEGKLVGAKGIEREKIIKQLEQERLKNQQIAADKKKEDARIKAADAQKLAIEKQKTKEQERQTQVQAELNALSAVQAAIGATVAGVEAAIAIAKAGAGGKFGYDNIALIIAATAAIAGAFVSVKNAAKGFAEGGYTGDGGKYEEAGVVHRGEYVVPAHIVANPAYSATIGTLETARTNGYASGGFVAPPVTTTAASVDMSVLIGMQQELVSLRKDTNAALIKPIYTSRVNDMLFDAKTTQITNYALQ